MVSCRLAWIWFRKTFKKEIAKLEQMINGYILQREQLVNVFVLVDIRLEAQKIDIDFINWLGASSVPLQLFSRKQTNLIQQKCNQTLYLIKRN